MSAKTLLILALLAACGYGAYRYLGTKEDAVDRGVAEMTGAAQVRRGQRAIAGAKARAGAATVTLVRQAVTRFKIERGRLPANLDEVREAGLLDAVPAGVVYDPDTGAVSGG